MVEPRVSKTIAHWESRLLNPGAFAVLTQILERGGLFSGVEG
jgi:hypothetical protein